MLRNIDSMKPRMKYILLLFIFEACNNEKRQEELILFPLDAKNVAVVNQTDENGKKQGLWRELDTINHRIVKEFYYMDDFLDSSYLVYKTNSADTLLFGYYKLGTKYGQWKYWDTSFNHVNKIEVYKNDTLIETKKH
jgi:hypothetical protein